MPEHRWSTYDPGTKGPEFHSRSDYGFGRVVEPAPRAPGAEPRTFWNRARDEVQAWLGDETAEQRLKRDARLTGKPREEADWRDEDDIVWGGDSVAEPGSAEVHEAHAEGGYKRPDTLIEQELADRMTDDPDFDASNVRVEVSGGEVRLSGHVADDEARLRAERLAKRTAGVLRVWNQLEVDAR